jgi:hypothetical protein
VTDRDAIVEEIARLVADLTTPREHVEPIYNGRKLIAAHATTQPGLLEQLRQVAHEGLKVEASGSPTGPAGKPASRPPGCFDALNAHVYIVTEARRWGATWGLYGHTTVEACLRGLVGTAPNLDDAVLSRLLKDARYWRGMAASATGWETRPYTPPVPCPLCSRFATLRLNMDNRSAYCTNRDRRPDGDLVCGLTWAPGTVDQLYAYIRGRLEAA